MPDKELYRRFGVEASLKSLHPRAWRAVPGGWRHAISDAITERRAPIPASPTNGIDADGRVVAVKYGAHAYDQWSVDELLALRAG